MKVPIKVFAIYESRLKFDMYRVFSYLLNVEKFNAIGLLESKISICLSNTIKSLLEITLKQHYNILGPPLVQTISSMS